MLVGVLPTSLGIKLTRQQPVFHLICLFLSNKKAILFDIYFYYSDLYLLNTPTAMYLT